jgi:hypothetical protein
MLRENARVLWMIKIKKNFNKHQAIDRPSNRKHSNLLERQSIA